MQKTEDWQPELPLEEWLEPVRALPIGEVRIEVTTGRELRFQDPLCSVVRGLLGARLRALRCLTGAPSCAGCGVRAACDYARIFEGDEGLAPHPFWLQGVPAERALPRGTGFSARLRLGPPAVASAGALETALREALRRVDPDARLGPMTFLCRRLGDLLGPAPAGPLRLRAETPLSLRGDEELCARLCPQAPWLALLVRAGVRRVAALLSAFAAPPAGPRRLPRARLPDLTGVLVRHGGLGPWESSRFSQRQRWRMPLQGLVGAAVLEGGATAEIAPLLQVLAHTSVGKATALGLGGVSVACAAQHTLSI